MTRTRVWALAGALGAGAIVSAAFVIALTARAPAEAPDALAAQTEEVAPAAEPSGGTQEGIKVHGRWIIEVRDPDGTLVSRTEFDNALQGGGATLAKVLSRERVVGEWRVSLFNLVSTLNPCEGATSTPASCGITESDESSPNLFPTLTVTRSGEQVVLSGTATAQRGGAINRVSTTLKDCHPAVPSSCSSQGQFTTQTITSVPVSQGQGILVTVTLSFS